MQNRGCGCERIIGLQGPQGIRGPRGPIGPQGEQGPAGGSLPDLIANFYNMAVANVEIAEAIPFNDVYNFDTADINHESGSATITLAEGYYHVTYITSVQSDVQTGVMGAVMTFNGVALPNSISVSTELNVGNSETLGASFIVYVPTDGTVMQLINGTEVTTTYNHINLIVRKLNV